MEVSEEKNATGLTRHAEWDSGGREMNLNWGIVQICEIAKINSALTDRRRPATWMSFPLINHASLAKHWRALAS